MRSNYYENEVTIEKKGDNKFRSTDAITGESLGRGGSFGEHGERQALHIQAITPADEQDRQHAARRKVREKYWNKK